MNHLDSKLLQQCQFIVIVTMKTTISHQEDVVASSHNHIN
jgi:hypothetical protein